MFGPDGKLNDCTPPALRNKAGLVGIFKGWEPQSEGSSSLRAAFERTEHYPPEDKEHYYDLKSIEDMIANPMQLQEPELAELRKAVDAYTNKDSGPA